MNSDVCRNKTTGANEIGQFLDVGMSIRSVAEEPEEVDDDELPGEDICVPDDPNDKDDCPKIFNMGGNSEMVLNKGVSVFRMTRREMRSWGRNWLISRGEG